MKRTHIEVYHKNEYESDFKSDDFDAERKRLHKLFTDLQRKINLIPLVGDQVLTPSNHSYYVYHRCFGNFIQIYVDDN